MLVCIVLHVESVTLSDRMGGPGVEGMKLLACFDDSRPGGPLRPSQTHAPCQPDVASTSAVQEGDAKLAPYT